MPARAYSSTSLDVVVIGGGVIGCAVAYYFSQHGVKVCLVDRQGIAGGTSGCCQGPLMVTPSPAYFSRLLRSSIFFRHAIAAIVVAADLTLVTRNPDNPTTSPSPDRTFKLRFCQPMHW